MQANGFGSYFASRPEMLLNVAGSDVGIQGLSEAHAP